jgi:HPt (histidine-containing phosphotransfer) domain-containing protein
MDDYVAKPVSAPELAAVLERWVRNGGAAADGTAPPTPDGDVLDPGVVANLRELDDDAGTLDDLVTAFVEDTNGRLAALRADAGRGDLEATARTAHSLKGSSVSMGATQMAEVCAELEAQARAGDQATAVATLDALEAAFAAVQPALRLAFPGAASTDGQS